MRVIVPILTVMVSFAVQPALAATQCAELAKLTLAHTTITSAETITAGSFTPPGTAPGQGAPRAYRSMPEFCRVTATVKPSSDSDIKIEVWMPASGWNGEFEGTGNGGWAGAIDYASMAEAVKAGYATAGTDTGHVGGSASFALGHHEKLVDYGHRAVHEMTVEAKTITDAYYGGRATRAIWNACSTGGRQGITEAERYPGDYEGVIAGASAIYSMAMHAARVAVNAYVHRSSESYIPPEKYAMVHAAVLQACDGTDGLKDGLIEDPLSCHFDPRVLECKGADGPSCLTAAQVETMRALYAPIKGLPGQPPLLQPGTELGWGTLGGPDPLPLSLEAFRFLVFKDPGWDMRRFSAATDLPLALKSDDNIVSLTNPNLKPFFDRGGKLLMYHGWADPQVPAQNSVRYFDDVVKATGKDVVGKSVQLYMVPGMGHCRGGEGTDTFDLMAAMEQWMSGGTAPGKILASHTTDGLIDRTRPLCPWGQLAKWKGTGNINDAANFVCVAESQ